MQWEEIVNPTWYSNLCSLCGKDPNAIINEKVSSGELTQAQLDQIQKQAQQMQGMFEGVRGMFGK